MSGNAIAVELQERTVIRKGLAKIRKDGLVPAVIHNHGKESIHVMGEFQNLTKIYQQAGKHHPVQLKVAGRQHLALIRDADFEPTKNRLRHVVFQAIKQDEKVSAEIPVVLEGDMPAEKKGLIVLTHLDVLEVDALPKDLVDEIKVDATGLAEEGDKLTVADITIPAGMTILTDPETVLATVETPRDQLAVANASAEDLANDSDKPAEEEAPAESEADAKTDTAKEA
jgi:large subunit ribosomal protein L25